MNSTNIKEELLDDDESDEDLQKFVPEVIIKKEHKNHKVIVKEATFKSESEEDDDDFDPFSGEVKQTKKPKLPKPPKPAAVVKQPKPVVEKPKPQVKNDTDPFSNDPDDDDFDAFADDGNDYFGDEEEPKPLETKVEVKLEEPEEPVAVDEDKDDSSDDENLFAVKQKLLQTTKKKRGRPRKDAVRDESNVVKPIKKRAYKAESGDDDDEKIKDSDYAPSDDDEDNVKQKKEKGEKGVKRPLKGPQITIDLKYSCLHEDCKKVPVFDTAFEFVDHMELAHQRTLSVVRIRNFIPWDRPTGAVVRIHPKKVHHLISCDKCNKQYSSHEGLKKHKALNKCDSIKGYYICKICHADLKRSDLRILHMNLMHPEFEAETTLKCLICEQQFETKESIAEHYSVVHLDNFTCRYCEKYYATWKTLLEHIKSQHENVGIICDICGRVTRCVTELKNHKESHKKDPIIKCDDPDCNLMFPSQLKMIYHWENVHNAGSYECPICQKVMTTKKKLHRHKYMLHSEKNYFCHLCGKGFLANGELTNHMLWHEGKWKPKKKKPQSKEKIHACSMCEFKTARSYSLKCHIKHVHMGEKRTYSAKAYAKKPFKRPRRDIIYKCDICHKEFNEKRFYRKHMTRKTVHIYHKCDKCGLDVFGLDNFRDHRKTHSKKIANYHSMVPINGGIAMGGPSPSSE